MKKIISSGVAVAALLVAVPAFAADLAKPYPTKAPMVVAEPVFSWTGFYIGGNLGGAWGSGNAAASNLGLDPDGFVGGGQVGVNYQFDNNVVIGIEADLQGGDVSASRWGYESKMDYFGTVRGRIGYAFDHILPYFTGGFAYGHSKLTDQLTGFSDSQNLTGWTVGGGVEYALTNNWTVKAEYLYMDLGDDYYNSIGANAGLTANIVRAGVNYKF
ncbi:MULTISPECIES: outer membrane protein [Ancylobacter]|uniref:Outer membrane immunogenic protein n=2 Tax=Ancylobacter TaxID=99 RepID=A0A839ZAX8_9HYPH|nr:MULTISPECIES: outer membrane protein [Ancylobacter]MBB3771889.1 outer membrane immunogenic protein [Ancylobacter tetraedralis]MDQ0509668.1 outer membrane immunogenic protein [Ancylobacter amanitiformis]